MTLHRSGRLYLSGLPARLTPHEMRTHDFDAAGAASTLIRYASSRPGSPTNWPNCTAGYACSRRRTTG
ncbi:hypothetical protein ABZ647_02235 [Micromonospora aurantiaca]|uniref:hypothetical protein n=1 Tax=Micromonospora aurantiaca (nom. illeg.) TaxID=47850 RepID=UPI002E183993